MNERVLLVLFNVDALPAAPVIHFEQALPVHAVLHEVILCVVCLPWLWLLLLEADSSTPCILGNEASFFATFESSGRIIVERLGEHDALGEARAARET